MGIFTAIKGWKTLGFSVAVGLFGVAETFDWSQVTSDQNAANIFIIVAFVNMVLRFFTNTPVTKRTPNEPFRLPGADRFLNR